MITQFDIQIFYVNFINKICNYFFSNIVKRDRCVKKMVDKFLNQKI